jgi:hypothetical protein
VIKGIPRIGLNMHNGVVSDEIVRF